MSNRTAAGIVVGVILLVGIIVGFVPHHVSAGSDSISCGSAFSPNGYEAAGASLGSDITAIYEGRGMDAGTDYEAECRDAVSTPRIFAIVLLGAGGLAGLFLLLTVKAAPVAAQEETE